VLPCRTSAEIVSSAAMHTSLSSDSNSMSFECRSAGGARGGSEKIVGVLKGQFDTAWLPSSITFGRSRRAPILTCLKGSDMRPTMVDISAACNAPRIEIRYVSKLGISINAGRMNVLDLVE
jgi:hypothetical protein